MWRVVRVVTVVDPEAAVSEVNGLLAQVEETFRATLDGASSADARIRLVPEALAAVFPVLLRVAPAVGAGMLSHTLLRRMTPSADPRDFERLMRALPNNVTTEMDLAVADLADVARRHPAVAAALTADEGSPQLDDIRPVEGGEAFCLATERFLDRYGIRGASEIDLARPRWRDDPSALLQVIAGNLERGGGHRERFAGLVADADAAADRIVRAAGRGPGGHFRRRIVKRLVANVRNYTGLRESPKFLMIKILGLVRTDALGVGERLVHEGRLDAPEDVFFLSLSELVGASGNRRDFRGVTSSRRDAHIRFSKLAPPGVMTSEGERVVAPAHRDLDRHQLGGTGASAGTVEGVARVLFDPVTERLESGEVLVTPFTDPGWTPLFVNASGLVMEVGGMMTHGSVVAREYGIPAVVGVAGATERIHTGMRIRVDGDQGLVELLDDDPAADVAS
jgi:pyruvate,water dikinase